MRSAPLTSSLDWCECRQAMVSTSKLVPITVSPVSGSLLEAPRSLVLTGARTSRPPWLSAVDVTSNLVLSLESVATVQEAQSGWSGGKALNRVVADGWVERTGRQRRRRELPL
jgi:hypothetical protein